MRTKIAKVTHVQSIRYHVTCLAHLKITACALVIK